MLQQRRAHLQRLACDEGRQQLGRRAQAQHRERHAHGLHGLIEPVQRAVGGADQRCRQGHVGRGELVQRIHVCLLLGQYFLQAKQGLRAWRNDDGMHSGQAAGLANVLVDRVVGHGGNPRRWVPGGRN